MIQKLAVIGVGLIGGSLARALREAGHVGEVVGFGRSLGNLQTATDLGVIDRAEVSVGETVRDADMIVVAVPLGSMADIFSQLATSMMDGAVVTDVGSVKRSVVTMARTALGARCSAFVPGHPIAGTEHSGVSASKADLFRHHRIILTPQDDTDVAAVARVGAMWQAVGGDVISMTVAEHDEVLAVCSHLPHVLAYALVDLLVRRDDHKTTFDLAAGGFRDFTRIASSDPTMWHDICLANRDALVKVLKDYQQNLDDLVS
ncbi:MAG: prephenate dehydrogenase/arogenate dehydrogenase family protein, partial [Gammaproteobacteria bacterium]|nr:prephenate dehydrogenase/arogenate dehydrogenase family protein [Gammaproteobacteria bacterium]